MFGNLGWPEIILLLLVALLLFGAKKLPDVGRSLGKGIREFKKALKGVDEDIEQEENKDKKEKSE
jgi:sec-independent protein translocase protein TatA